MYFVHVTDAAIFLLMNLMLSAEENAMSAFLSLAELPS